MREILFRGKRLDTGEWVEGFYATNPEWDRRLYGEHHWIISCKNAFQYEIDPATVGQYTGLTDRNGKRIFEGDVLVSFFCDDVPNYGERSVVLWHKHAWCSRYRDYKPETLEDYEMTNYVDVIGNIYDNPELLEKEAGK